MQCLCNSAQPLNFGATGGLNPNLGSKTMLYPVELRVREAL